jgi:hypothetical protein
VADDQDVRLSTILDWLATGHISTEQAASRMRSLHFGPVPQHSVGRRMADDAHGDIPAPMPGEFRQVSQALAEGKIDRPQYEALAEAAAAAMRAHGDA